MLRPVFGEKSDFAMKLRVCPSKESILRANNNRNGQNIMKSYELLKNAFFAFSALSFKLLKLLLKKKRLCISYVYHDSFIQHTIETKVTENCLITLKPRVN